MNFNNGVTGIVGPNGSGKSNISDAVRWVLGEQKVKQLRGAAMQDVIFAGTELRKAQGFAFVSITLDNSDRALPVDYTEVTISRKLFRSGESDYMINGQSVRLRDIQELFYDTGIGREGYSIIGQGQIDAIINGRPQDRRGLFDEAAGIVKFKKRKAAAIKRLESERENMVRISDLMGELERRIRPLERQSETAKVYLKLRDEQKKLDLNLFIRQTESLLNDLEKSRNNLSIVRASLEETEEENAKLKESSSQLFDRIQTLDTNIQKKKDDQAKAELIKENLNGQISVSEAEIRASEETVERLRLQIGKLQQEHEDILKTAAKYLDSLRELEESLDLVEEGNEGETVEFSEISVLRANIAAFRKKLADIGIHDFQDRDPKTGGDRSGSGDISGKEQEEEAQTGFVLPDWMRRIKNKKDELSEIREKEERTSEWLNRATDEYNALTKTVRDLENHLNEQLNLYAGVNAKLESIKNIAERYEGYGESIRALMREKSRFRGIRGVVADLLSTAEEYETAIEIALGARIQYIVTDHEEDAKNCIEYLKKTRQGRATFLPLDAVRFREQQELKQAVREPGAVGIAADLTETAEEYTELKNYLLGTILVVDGIGPALAIARKYRHALRIVTLEGELLSPGGSISGGTYKNNSRLMGRKREITELENRLREIGRTRDGIREKISRQEKLIREKSDEIDDLNASMKQISEERNNLSFGITADMRMKFSELRQKIGFAGENIDRIVLSAGQGGTEIEKSEEEKNACLERISRAEQTVNERKEDIAHLESGLETVLQELSALQEEKEKLTGEQSGFAKRKEEVSASILELQKDVLRLENQVEKQQQKLDDETSYIWNEYEMSLSSAGAYRDDTLGSTTAMKTRLNAVKSEIRGLGPVNVQAIEEYKEVSERYGFMKKQYDDLSASEQSILGIIDELDTGMKRQFDEQFANIKEQFRIVFRELFGGGEADLDLVFDQDEETRADELEAGVSIIVQPPGKKLQNIMQLSGGEKALTAIALLFAIQNLKPSPFCLLDEIEAALDDSNVTRFANYLHKLTDQTQFIVITHRRGTMESADRLYGVTMQEKGITKLVSVDLVSDQLT